MRTTKLLLALVLLAIGHGASAQSLTFTSSTFAVGTEDSGPDCVATADVNGDGRLDLISALYGFRWGLPGDPGGWNTNLTVLTNNGSGGFVFNATLTVGHGPTSIAAADVNRDGKPDLISANETENTLTVLTNNGSGVFGSNATLAVGIRPHGVVAVDVNGDGTIDLMCVNAGANTLTVLTNQGGGVFASGATLSVGSEPLALVAADVNGDGKPDLISANKIDDTLTVLTNDGRGGFAFSATLPVGHYPDWVSAADLNGDGKVDLVSVNWGAATMTVLTNNGRGIFGFNATLAIGNYPSSVAAADFNGDGKADLICASTEANSLSVLTNNGSGGFGYNTTLPVGRIPNVWPADFNSDGKLDLACPNFRDGTVTVLLNTTAFPQSWTTNNLPPGLISWWQAEGNYLDSAGTNQGTPVGGVTFALGHAGQGFVFNGTNQGVIIPHATSLNVPPTGFTVEFWMKAGRDQPEAVSSMVDKDHSAQDNTGWEVSCWRDTGRLSAGIGDGSSFPLFTNLTDVLDNQFHHVAFAWDKTNWLIYVNGVLENSLYRPAIANDSRPLRFGYHWGDGTGTPMRHFKGLLDDVRIYNRALTETEIASLALRVTLVNAGCVGTDFTFSFQTVSNFSYTVEYNDDLRATNWNFYTNCTGNGSLMQVVAAFTSAPHRFFRVATH